LTAKAEHSSLSIPAARSITAASVIDETAKASPPPGAENSWVDAKPKVRDSSRCSVCESKYVHDKQTQPSGIAPLRFGTAETNLSLRIDPLLTTSPQEHLKTRFRADNLPAFDV
jgi:hypothetical protein